MSEVTCCLRFPGQLNSDLRKLAVNLRKPRALRHRLGHVPREDEHQRGRRADDQHAEQELVLLRGVDPQQREVQRV
jgi:hypothetical protein